jgi:DNA-directed RNA polymerase specialized sigma24 family protein
MATSAQSALDLEALYNMPLDPQFREHFWDNAIALRKHFFMPMRRKYQELGEPIPHDSDLEARLHETFVSIVEKQQYGGIIDPYPFLLTAVLRDIDNEISIKRNRRKLELEHARETYPHIPVRGGDGKHTLEPIEAYDPETPDLNEAVRQAIASLPEEYRQVMMAALQGGPKPYPIACRLHRSHRWVDRRLEAAKEMMGFWLVEHGVVDVTVYTKTAENAKYRAFQEELRKLTEGRGGTPDVITTARPQKRAQRVE